ncbi:MAG: carotenoid biosynthesis protein [Halolamina sp.]
MDEQQAPASEPIADREATRYVASQLLLFALTFGHALLTWPFADAVGLFVGGAAVAFIAEVLAIRAGLFTHHLRPQLADVPLTILLAWPAVVYVAVRVATLLVNGPVVTAATAAVLATLLDLATDPAAVEDGAWEFHREEIPGPWFSGVPWWNFAGWLLIVFVTAMLPYWL